VFLMQIDCFVRDSHVVIRCADCAGEVAVDQTMPFAAQVQAIAAVHVCRPPLERPRAQLRLLPRLSEA
jgi:hypothetical protein